MITKQYNILRKISFDEEKKDRILKLFENPENIRRNSYVLEFTIGSPVEILRIIHRISYAYMIIPQYEITLEGEGIEGKLGGIEKILELS